MNSDEYRLKLTQLNEVNRTNLIALGKWVQNEALPWLWDELGGVILTPKQKHPMATTSPAAAKLKPMKDAEAVRQGLITSIAERKKLAEPSFYQAQLTMLDSEARRYCKTIDGFWNETSVVAEEAVVHTLHRALKEMMSYATILLEDAAREVTNLHGYFAAWRRTHETAFEIFKGAEQVVYGTYSRMTHTDRTPYISVAVLRTAIEIRIRQAFCVSSFIDPTKPEDLVPIDLSKLFEAIQTRQGEIEFAVDFHDVWKIYRWSNFYLHAGVRDFPWVSGFLIQYLRPLFADQRRGPNGSWNINGGIRMKREAWQAVRSALLPQIGKSSLAEKLTNAWRALRLSNRRQLELPVLDERAASCMFLD